MNVEELLMQSPDPWVVYRTLLDLRDKDNSDTDVQNTRQHMLEHPLVKGIMEELEGWPGVVLSSHKSAGQMYHKLEFLADLGITEHDGNMSHILFKVMEYPSEDGIFQISMNIPVHFGGSGEDEAAWALCDAPVLLYSLAKMGRAQDPAVLRGVRVLMQLVRDNGWPCAVSPKLGKFRGPGRKADPCPYANLIMLKLLALYDEYRDCRESRIGVECLLTQWEKSMEQHPYMFFMGNDFRKLKAPFIWYDILHVTDVISQFPFAVEDKRFLQMLDTIRAKANADGLYTPESEWTAWKGWEFAQKKVPSLWVTFLVRRLEKRAAFRSK
jgi:hypothetical protein